MQPCLACYDMRYRERYGQLQQDGHGAGTRPRLVTIPRTVWTVATAGLLKPRNPRAQRVLFQRSDPKSQILTILAVDTVSKSPEKCQRTQQYQGLSVSTKDLRPLKRGKTPSDACIIRLFGVSVKVSDDSVNNFLKLTFSHESRKSKNLCGLRLLSRLFRFSKRFFQILPNRLRRSGSIKQKGKQRTHLREGRPIKMWDNDTYGTD